MAKQVGKPPVNGGNKGDDTSEPAVGLGDTQPTPPPTQPPVETPPLAPPTAPPVANNQGSEPLRHVWMNDPQNNSQEEFIPKQGPKLSFQPQVSTQELPVIANVEKGQSNKALVIDHLTYSIDPAEALLPRDPQAKPVKKITWNPHDVLEPGDLIARFGDEPWTLVSSVADLFPTDDKNQPIPPSRVSIVNRCVQDGNTVLVEKIGGGPVRRSAVAKTQELFAVLEMGIQAGYFRAFDFIVATA